MPRIIENEDLYETWKNLSPGTIIIKRIDRNGKIIDELVSGPKTFHITPNERRLNQEMVAEVSYDPFTNGVLMPVRLIDGEDDVAELKDNPNILSESEMREFFKGKAYKAFGERVSGLTNSIALNRLLEIAEEEDATVRQVEIIRTRLAEVSGGPAVVEVETVSGPRRVT